MSAKWYQLSQMRDVRLCTHGQELDRVLQPSLDHGLYKHRAQPRAEAGNFNR